VFVSWTGHRPELFLDPLAGRVAVESVATELTRGSEVSGFLVGGQRGVDTWAALAAMSRRLPFTLALPLPVPEFSHDWSDEDRSMLERTVALARPAGAPLREILLEPAPSAGLARGRGI
jgi:hypothetical protein